MSKKILITGATDGIGLEAAKLLLADGHELLLHGRNSDKLEQVSTELAKLGSIHCYNADLSDLDAVKAFAEKLRTENQTIDVLVNNAGVLKTNSPIAACGIDVRFVVNTIAPYLLTKMLLPILGNGSRIVNLASAAQAPVQLEALSGNIKSLDAGNAYAMSKLAIIMWTRVMAKSYQNSGRVFVALNPGSLIGTKMVKEGYGISGQDLSVGASIIQQAAIADNFADSSGKYFDNDSGNFSSPHPDALDDEKCDRLVQAIEQVLEYLH